MDEEEAGDGPRGERFTSLWWMYPHEQQDCWIMTCAWIWICFFTVLIQWIDQTYYDGYGSVPLVLGIMTLFILIITCGRGPCYWIHKDVPWAILVGAMFVLLFIEVRH